MAASYDSLSRCLMCMLASGAAFQQATAPWLRSEVVGLALPVYQTYKTIESRQTDRAAQTKWLTYWAAFGTLTAMEKVLGPYISW